MIGSDGNYAFLMESNSIQYQIGTKHYYKYIIRPRKAISEDGMKWVLN